MIIIMWFGLLSLDVDIDHDLIPHVLINIELVIYLSYFYQIFMLVILFLKAVVNVHPYAQSKANVVTSRLHVDVGRTLGSMNAFVHLVYMAMDWEANVSVSILATYRTIHAKDKIKESKSLLQY